MKTVEGIPKDFSKGEKLKAIRYLGIDRRRFGRVVEEFFIGPFRHTQRAAGPLEEVIKRHPELLRPHIKRFLVQLDKQGNYPAITRNILRLLQHVAIPQSLEGRAVNSCMRIIQDREELVAAKVFSMTVLANIASRHPELKNEVQAVIQSQYPYSTPAYRSRARKALLVLQG